MKNLYRKFNFIFLIAVSILLVNFTTYAAAINVPEKVRVGLFYSSTAVSSFTVKAEKGLQLGYVKDNKFNALYEDAANGFLTIKKDTDFHVQMGGNYKDLKAVKAQIQSLKQKGITAYPVYTETWQVWTGFYKDQATAQAEITGNIEKKLGKGTYKVIQPSIKGIVSTNANGEILLLYANEINPFQIHPREENKPYAFNINNTRSYRGDLEVRRFSGSDMTLINVIKLEEYLYGVVPCEIEADSHIEAVKAQAVAARTYTLNNLGKHGTWEFDLDTTTYDQVYKGLNFEHPSAIKAVDETKGEKVTYNGKLASVFYFASSGGRTEDSKNVWSGDYPYLKSVEDKYESGNSWHYTWEVTLTAERVRDILKSKGYDVGEVVSMEVTKTSEAGRVIELLIKGTKGQQVFTKSNCRYIFGLDSQWYTINGGGSGSGGRVNIKLGDSVIAGTRLFGQKIMTAQGLKTVAGSVAVVDANGVKKNISSSNSRSEVEPGIFKISGRGWGHGVGMSQEGAKGMAKAGFKYNQILTHYFQGTKIE